ncbi:MAG: hypothetical protein JO367_21250 [Actinobacteria bacterium]|nr:hypothetical protein [Actinomycetota bacterium]
MTNSGTAAATTGSNKASGNTSQNTSADSNSSNGHASIETGPAVAKGNIATTNVMQSATTNATKHGASIIDQSANVTNRGVAIARTGNNGVTDDGSTGGAPLKLVPLAKTVLGGTLTPLPTSSGGTTPTVPLSGTHLGSSVSSSAAPVSAVPLWTNTPSTLTAEISSTPVDPLATVPDRSNRVMGAISGAGPPDILTGPATATGNEATTGVSQSAIAAGDGLAIIDEPVAVTNLGKATANTGHNGNATELTTGTATATGNLATTTVTQSASAWGTSVTLIDQPVRVSDVGAALATTGHNDSDTRLSTGDATAFGDRALVTVDQMAATPAVANGRVAHVGQNVNAAGLGSARAATGNNSVKNTGDDNDDGHAHIDTGNADALGADVATDIKQASA